MFKAEKFDFDAWAKFFKEDGVKYVIPIAEHHDGFAIYKTSIS
jgi:alpha-L-fucosidase